MKTQAKLSICLALLFEEWQSTVLFSAVNTRIAVLA